MLATLPMYDWPEVWAENDTLWAAMRDALRAEGIDAPDALDRRVGYEESWTRSDLVLGEVCGLPYIKGLSEDVSLIGLVAEGRATFAAIDAHTWEIALKHEPRCEAVRVIANTPPTPGPVYIAAKGADVEAYRRALPSVIPVTADDYKSLF